MIYCLKVTGLYTLAICSKTVKSVQLIFYFSFSFSAWANINKPASAFRCSVGIWDTVLYVKPQTVNSTVLQYYCVYCFKRAHSCWLMLCISLQLAHVYLTYLPGVCTLYWALCFCKCTADCLLSWLQKASHCMWINEQCRKHVALTEVPDTQHREPVVN